MEPRGGYWSAPSHRDEACDPIVGTILADYVDIFIYTI